MSALVIHALDMIYRGSPRYHAFIQGLQSPVTWQLEAENRDDSSFIEYSRLAAGPFLPANRRHFFGIIIGLEVAFGTPMRAIADCFRFFCPSLSAYLRVALAGLLLHNLAECVGLLPDCRRLFSNPGLPDRFRNATVMSLEESTFNKPSLISFSTMYDSCFRSRPSE